MRSTKRCNPSPLFLIVVITLALSVLAAWMIGGILLFEAARADDVTQRVTITRPQFCSQYLVEYSEDDWNEETETYPINEDWNNCMGVGRK